MQATVCDPTDFYTLDIADDRLSVTLRAGPAGLRDGIDPAEILNTLRGRGLVVDDAVQAKLAEQTDASGRVRLQTDLVLIQGTAAVDDQVGSVQLTGEVPQEGRELNHYERSRILTAAAGDVIATLTPAVEGKDGVDVFGKPIPHRKAADLPVELGARVKLDADGRSVRAECAGRVVHRLGKISVENVLNIAGNVDFSTGKVQFDGDIDIGGSILDLFSVSAGGSIQVNGAIEGAEVSAGHDVHVGGGIVAKGKGYVKAGGSVVAKFIDNAHISAGQDVSIRTEVGIARVICGGVLRADHGTIVSGHVTAGAGVNAKSLGNTGDAKLLIEAGIDQSLRDIATQQLPEMARQQAKVAKIREMVAPLMNNPKRLTAAQKEKATELLYEADEVEVQIRKVVESITQRQQQLTARGQPTIRVAYELHSGVVVRFPGVQAVIPTQMRGPLRVVVRTVNGVKQIVVIDDTSGKSSPLETRPFEDEAMQSITRFLKEQMKAS